MSVQETCAALAALIPALAAALPRDSTGAKGTSPTAAIPVNPGVLHAIDVLHREVPPETARARALIGETGRGWDPVMCLRHIPRIHTRLVNLDLAQDAAQLEHAAGYWLRVVKQALGLRTPDIPIGYPCPYHDAPGTGLLAAGSEGFLRREGDGITVEWAHAARVYCPGCGTSWGPAEWPMLGRMLKEAS